MSRVCQGSLLSSLLSSVYFFFYYQLKNRLIFYRHSSKNSKKSFFFFFFFFRIEFFPVESVTSQPPPTHALYLLHRHVCVRVCVCSVKEVHPVLPSEMKKLFLCQAAESHHIVQQLDEHFAPPSAPILLPEHFGLLSRC